MQLGSQGRAASGGAPLLSVRANGFAFDHAGRAVSWRIRAGDRTIGPRRGMTIAVARRAGVARTLAGGRRRTDTGGPAHTAALPPPAPLDPTKVVPISNPDRLELLKEAGDEIKLSDEKLVSRPGHRPDPPLSTGELAQRRPWAM